MFIWQWVLGRGPECSRRALAKWLGTCTAYVLILQKKLPKDEAEFEREVARSGAPTVEELRAAREKSRSMRARGLLLKQLPFKEIRDPGSTRLKTIPTKPNWVTLALDGKIPLEPPRKDAPRRGRQKRKRHNGGPSREQALRNLQKAWANYKPPRAWRSASEGRVARMLVWQWALGRGPQCSQRALCRWLGVSEGWVRKLKRTLPLDEAEFLREVARNGVPTLEALERARRDSRLMRERGMLRTQRPYKVVKCEWQGLVHYETIRAKPLNVTLALDGVTPLEPPGAVGVGKPGLGRAAVDDFATRMWQVTMREEREKKVKPVMRRRWGRR